MIEYKVGETFPFPNTQPAVENCRAQIVGSSFDVLYYIDRPKKKEIRTFRDEFLRFHICIIDHIPFMSVSYLGERWTYDFTLTVVGRDEDIIENFLRPGNAVNLFLIDATTNELLAARLIGLNSEAESMIKLACREQRKNYTILKEVDRVINRVYLQNATDELIKKSKTFEFKKK